MSNGVAAAVAAGVISFGAALGASFVLFGQPSKESAADAKLAGIEKRLSDMSEKSADNEPSDDKNALSQRDLRNLEIKLNKKIQTGFEALRAEMKDIKPAKAELKTDTSTPDLEAFKKAILEDIQGNFDALADKHAENARLKREAEAEAKRVEAEQARQDKIALLRTSGAQQVVDAISAKLDEKGIIATDMAAFKTAYQTQLNKVLELGDKIKQMRDNGEEVDRNISRELWSGYRETRETYKTALGDAAWDEVRGDVDRAGVDASRTILGRDGSMRGNFRGNNRGGRRR